MKPTVHLILSATIALLAGCATQKITPQSPEPKVLLIVLEMSSTDQRYTRFEVDRQGMLHYAGGTMAAAGMTRPVAPLTQAQRRVIWHTITQADLFNAESSAAEKGRDVTYRLDLRADGVRHTLRSVDDEHPGVKRLQEKLFQIQMDHRYPE